MRAILRVFLVALPIVAILVVGVIGIGAMQAMRPKPEKADEAPRGLAIFTEPVRLENVQLTVKTEGEVRPRREVAISSQISGRVTYVAPNFIEGGFVRRGDILIRVEDADYRLGVTRARASVASAEQRLAREIAEAEQALKDLDDLGVSDASALARREPQLAEARAAVDSAEAQLKDAELALARTVVRAPFDGRVRSEAVDIGQFVSPGAPLGQVFGTDIAEVPLPLTDAELGRLGLSLAFAESRDVQGPPVLLRADVAGAPRTWRGRITRTGAAVDSRTRLVSAIAEVEDPFGAGADRDAPLAPGLFVTAVIEGETIENVLVAPREALRRRDELYVANPEDSTLSIRKVEILFTDPTGVYMTSGVAPGELAIISPVQAGFEGMSITIAGQEADEDDDGGGEDAIAVTDDEEQDG